MHCIRWRRLAATGAGIEPASDSPFAGHERTCRALVYEDREWPKPGHCAGTPVRAMQEWSNNEHVVSHRHRFVTHLTWKAGITSVQDWLKCTFGEEHAMDVKGRRASPERLSAEVSGSYLRVGMVREPLARFVSGYRELLLRRMLWGVTELKAVRRFGYSVGYPRESVPSWFKQGLLPGPALAAGESPQRWLERVNCTEAVSMKQRGRHWLRACNPSTLWGWVGIDPTTGAVDEQARLEAYVRAVECGLNFDMWAHTATQGYFFAGHYVDDSLDEQAMSSRAQYRGLLRTRTDLVLKAERLDRDLPALKCRVDQALEAARELTADADRACALQQLNANNTHFVSGSDNAGVWAEASATAVRGFLDSDERLVRRLCAVYMQDFICFGYALPHPCKELLPAGEAQIVEAAPDRALDEIECDSETRQATRESTFDTRVEELVEAVAEVEEEAQAEEETTEKSSSSSSSSSAVAAVVGESAASVSVPYGGRIPEAAEVVIVESDRNFLPVFPGGAFAEAWPFSVPAAELQSRGDPEAQADWLRRTFPNAKAWLLVDNVALVAWLADARLRAGTFGEEDAHPSTHPALVFFTRCTYRGTANKHRPDLLLLCSRQDATSLTLERAAQLDAVLPYVDATIEQYRTSSRKAQRKVGRRMRFFPLFAAPKYVDSTWRWDAEADDAEATATTRNDGYMFVGGSSGRDFRSVVEGFGSVDAARRGRLLLAGKVDAGASDLCTATAGCENQGFVSQERYLELMQAASAVVIPFYKGEPLGRGLTSVVEAQTLGKVILTVRTPTFEPYLADGRNAILVGKAERADLYEEAIASLKTDAALATCLARGAAEAKKALSPAGVAQRLREVIDDVLVTAAAESRAREGGGEGVATANAAAASSHVKSLFEHLPQCSAARGREDVLQ